MKKTKFALTLDVLSYKSSYINLKLREYSDSADKNKRCACYWGENRSQVWSLVFYFLKFNIPPPPPILYAEEDGENKI